MNRARIGLPTSFLALILAACGPTEQQIAAAIAQTQQAAPTTTSTPSPTSTAAPTATATETPTATPTATPTPDLRVIDQNPKTMLLTARELPQDGRFYLVYESPNRNSEILSGWGVEEGQRYLEASGRVDGWSIEWQRGTRTVRVPEWLHINVILYRTQDGPGYATETLGRCEDKIRSSIPWQTQEAPELGDDTYLCLSRETQPSGKDYLTYELWFARRNVAVQLWVGGLEGSFDLDWLVNIGRMQLEKIETFPLVDTATFRP